MTSPERKPARRGRAALVTAAVLLAVLLAGFVLRTPLLTGLGRFLVVDDAPYRPADLIFVLNGDYNARPFLAGELYLQGLAPRVVIARVEESPASEMGLVPNETEISLGVMEGLGVPDEALAVLTVPGGVTSTHDEAVLLRRHLEGSGLWRVLVVTSAFHTRRARWILERELDGLGVELQMAAAPHAGFGPDDWWRHENGLIAVNNEYIKLAYYFWTYR